MFDSNRKAKRRSFTMTYFVHQKALTGLFQSDVLLSVYLGHHQGQGSVWLM